MRKIKTNPNTDSFLLREESKYNQNGPKRKLMDPNLIQENNQNKPKCKFIDVNLVYEKNQNKPKCKLLRLQDHWHVCIYRNLEHLASLGS